MTWDPTPAAPARVGIVIPAHQAQQHIAATLASLSAQTLEDWWCVVVDDGSTDDTAAVVARAAEGDLRIHLLRSENGGVSRARNLGLEAMPPGIELVCFVDSDDLLLPGALAALVDLLDRRPDAVGASGLAEYIDGEGRPIIAGEHPRKQLHRLVYRGVRSRVLDPSEDATYDSQLILGAIWPPATALVRRRSLAAAGGFDPALVSQEDWDLYLRVSRLGPIALLLEQVAWYRRHPSNASKDNAEYIRSVTYVHRKQWDSADGVTDRLVVIRANVHFVGWLLQQNLRLLRADLRAHRWRASLCALAWVLALTPRLARLVPVVPSRRLTDSLVSLDRRTRGRAFLDEGP